MWPFKKRTNSKAEPLSDFQSILCIPGEWKDWNEFIVRLLEATSGEYIAAGKVLMHTKSQRFFELEFRTRDENMRKSFAYAGLVNRVSESFLNRINDHSQVLYLLGKGGTLKDAANIACAGEAILKAGGLGVKVETAGKAFEQEQWSSFLESFSESHLYDMFVLDSIANDEGSTYSCGMHNFGLKDTIVRGEEFQHAVRLIRIFNFYQIVDKPSISNGQTFSREIDSEKYRVEAENDQPNKGCELFENPFGMWQLTRL
ncbi:hypothetical protein ACX0G7_25995 [Flavitalea antarctica]